MRRSNPWPLLSLCLVAAAAHADLTDTRREELRAILHQDCGSCHGLTLKGGLGPALVPQTLAGKPRDFLIATILDGRPGTAMPPWRPLLRTEEAAWLVDILLGDAEEMVR